MARPRLNKNLPVIRHFFKVMVPGFRTKLSIPISFCRQLNGERSKEAILMSRKGSWHVKIKKCSEGTIHFKEGWHNFVQQHDLDIGDFLVFEHKGRFVFEVLVFGPSACEKELPLLSGNKRKRAPLGKNHAHEHTKRIKRQSPLEEAASYSPRNPHFTTTIQACNGIQIRPYMTIPADFVKSNELSKQTSLSLRDPLQKLWPVKLTTRQGSTKNSTRVIMSRGWSHFYLSNNLKKGDVCIFELSGTTSKPSSVLLDVHIFPI